MSRVFVTGSADGLGRLSASQLVHEGHEVVLHARSDARGREALDAVPGAAGVVTADLSSVAQTRGLAEQANASGRFDAVIHNAALGYQVSGRSRPRMGWPRLFAVNVLAPYLLTALMTRPDRLVYMSSGMHTGGTPPLTTCSGQTAAGAAPRPTRTPSCLTSRSPSPSRAAGPMSAPTR